MPAYAWKGKNRLGEVQEGVIVAEGRDSAVASLKRNGIQVLSVKSQSATAGKSLGKVKSRDLAIFTRQFSVMIDRIIFCHLYPYPSVCTNYCLIITASTG